MPLDQDPFSINMREKPWGSLLAKLINVLRINLAIVDNRGNIVFLPNDKKYGANTFALRQLGLDWSWKERFIEQFKASGDYFEFTDYFDLVTYAIPIKDKGAVLYYLLVGPVIVNHRLSADEYMLRAGLKNISMEEVTDLIHELRIVSHVMIKSVLDMLQEICQMITANVQERSAILELDPAQSKHTLMASLLDAALALTGTDHGSIMILDEPGTLTVKVSKAAPWTEGAYKQKVGEGISGLAAKNNEVFHITPGNPDNRIKHLLKRPEITESIVIPITDDQGVCGVLNLHTQAGSARIKENIDNLQHLSRLISAAV